MSKKRRMIRYGSFTVGIFLYAFFVIINPAQLFSEPDTYWVKRLLEKDQKSKPVKRAKEQIYRKNDILYCTGSSKIAKVNNKGAEHMEEGNYDQAIKVLAYGLDNYALFFPFRYNIGVCYIHKKQYDQALLHLEKAMYIVPEYAPTYIQIGYIHEMSFKDDIAIDFYRKALKLNPKAINTNVLIGDIYFKRKQYTVAKRYYQRCLQLDYRFPDALLGNAKIHFIKKEYDKAMVLLKSIDRTGEYNKSLHFYYAECAYELKDYRTASEHYSELLKHKTDKFFLSHDLGYVEIKLKLSDQLKQLQIN